MGGTSYHPNLVMFMGKPIMLWYPNFKKGGEIKLAFFGWHFLFVVVQAPFLGFFKKMPKKAIL